MKKISFVIPVYNEGENILISPVLISHPSGIKGSVDLKCKGPNNKDINTIIGILLQNDNYRFDIPATDINYAGKYSCKISATANNGKQNSQDFVFEVMCGGPKEYGSCDNNGRCNNNNANGGGLECYSQTESSNKKLIPV